MLSTFHSIAQQSACKKPETLFSIYSQDFRAIMCKIQLPFELGICHAFELMFVGYHCCSYHTNRMVSHRRRNHSMECGMTTQTNDYTYTKQSFTHIQTNRIIAMESLTSMYACNEEKMLLELGPKTSKVLRNRSTRVCVHHPKI